MRSADARAGCGAAAAGAGDVDGRVRLHVGDRHVENREPALPLDDPGRELDAAKVTVLGERRLDQHVAENRIRRPRLDLLHEVLSR